MRRALRRSLRQNADRIDSILKVKLRKELKKREISFIEKNGEFISDQNELVKKLYEEIKLEVLVAFIESNGKLHILKDVILR